ncbi:ricin-type beta-trefoil lectin domain protein [Gordonia polyisoprenivorans]|uniref:ricin-type beta-trefoil lectin domain protein n=1 Tax=Gordonia polyisoprenivorans TaxID=84595 RepID=UPI003A5C0987
MRKAVCVVVCSILGIAGMVLANGPASATDSTFMVKSVLNGQCLDNSDAAARSGNRVLLYECHDGINQQWTVGADGRARVQGLCLQPVGAVIANGRNLEIATCSTSPAQVWGQGANDSLRPNYGNYCLTAANGAVSLRTCAGTTAQRWTLTSAAATPTTTTTTTPTTTTTTTPTTTTPTTTTSAPAAVTSPSGQTAPTADLAGWRHIFADEFTKNAALGSWANTCEPDKIVYTGAQGQKWRTYPQCYLDTYQKRPYRPDAVLSVDGGMLDFFLRQVDGKPAGANPSPLITGSSQYQTYGRYSVRMRVDRPGLSEYYVAFLLWPQSEQWPAGGEFDFPEGSLAGTAKGYHHYSGLGSCVSCQAVATDIGATFTSWHTYTMEWSPGRIRYLLDNTVVLDTTAWVPSGPMRWQLQAETNGNGTSSGHLQVDWVSVWAYNG